MPGLYPVDGGGITGVSPNIGPVNVSGGQEMAGYRRYGSDLVNTVQFTRPSTGEKYDPTGTPTATFYVNNVVNSTIGSLNMTKLNSKTGFYGNPNVAGGFSDSNGFSVGDIVTVHVEAVVDGVNVAGIVDKFQIIRNVATDNSGYVTITPLGLDQIAMTVPTAFPTTFTEKLRAMMSLFTNKSQRSKQTGVVTIFADDHSTAALTFTTTPDMEAASTITETKTQVD